MSDAEDIRKRLRKTLGRDAQADGDRHRLRRDLTRRRRSGAKEPDESGIVYRRDLPVGVGAGGKSAGPHGPVIALDEAVTGEEVAAADGSRGFVITETLTGADRGWDALRDDLSAALKQRGTYLTARLGETFGPGRFEPGELVFMDLETTGLGSSPLFLVGAMVVSDAGLELRQYFARSYAEERAVISLFADLAAGRRLLVTFNGKSYDLPYVRMRAAAVGLKFDFAPHHFDLLHESRRVWKHTLPDCKLQTLERHVCRRHRSGDIPGSAIPDAYHAYVRTANATQMVEVLKHNRLDLITLAELMVRLARHRVD